MSGLIWNQDTELSKDPPAWSLTGRMCLWSDGSPAHVQQERFRRMGSGWEAYAQVDRSERHRTRKLSLTLRLEAEVRSAWDLTIPKQADHSFEQLSKYLQLREWYQDDLGVLYLK